MKTAKQEAAAMIQALPDDATFEDMQYRLYVLERIREGLESLKTEGAIPHAEVKRRLAEWRNR
jgi:hypothetical protein